MAWTYFSPELTLNEMELVENKDDKYMRSFKMLNNADVNEAEMKESSSSSKYVSAYCRRKTIKIDRPRGRRRLGFKWTCQKYIQGPIRKKGSMDRSECIDLCIKCIIAPA